VYTQREPIAHFPGGRDVDILRRVFQNLNPLSGTNSDEWILFKSSILLARYSICR